jgi:CheY-like chemotaxis protein
VAIELSDNGPGLPADQLDRIFEPFFDTRPIGRGSGLGLPVCRELVAAAGGSIAVDSAPGRGTTIRVVLPVADPVPEPAPATPPIPRRARILVLDDDPMIRELLHRLLADDHEVAAFDDPRRAVAAIEAGQRFDVIVCDLMMPQLTGMDVFDRITTLAPEQARRMMFITGGAFTIRAREFMARTTNPSLDKPFTSETLLRAVQQILGRP